MVASELSVAIDSFQIIFDDLYGSHLNGPKFMNGVNQLFRGFCYRTFRLYTRLILFPMLPASSSFCKMLQIVRVQV